jgi:hypothetical protein
MGALPVWGRLAGDLRIDRLEDLATTIRLEDLDAYVEKMFRGQIVGRVIVDLTGAA